jgi:tetratricopeptide (TPR) repeat protein
VNLQLARLEAARDLPAAIRYYQDALDALWAPASADRSRSVRRELITLLQQHGERARALSQALVYAAELPPTPEWQMQAAHLLLELGDPRRALDRYLAVLETDPRSREARAGAGEAAFALGDYAVARRYLTQAQPLEPRLASLRRVADLVLTVDPLAPRLRRSERERRLQQIVRHARDRIDSCGGTTAVQDRDPAVEEELRSFEPARARGDRRTAARADVEDPDARVERGIELALRVERTTAACGPQDDMGRAVTIVARDHGLDGNQ